MDIIRLPEWAGGQVVDDVLVNFDNVIKIESAVYDLEVKREMEWQHGSSEKWAEACEDSSNFGVSKVSFTNDETLLVACSVNEIMKKIWDHEAD